MSALVREAISIAIKKMTVITIQAEDFLDTITSDTLTCICFTSFTHLECRGFNQIFSMMSDNHPDITFADVDLQKNPMLAKEFNIQEVPTIMLFRQGVIIFSQKGALSFAELESLMDNAKQIDIDEVRTEIRKLGE